MNPWHWTPEWENNRQAINVLGFAPMQNTTELIILLRKHLVLRKAHIDAQSYVQAPRDAFSIFRFALLVFQSWKTIKSIEIDEHGSTSVELEKSEKM